MLEPRDLYAFVYHRKDGVSRLARALFEREEARLPEGDTWDSLTEGDRAFYRDLAREVVRELENILFEANESVHVHT